MIEPLNLQPLLVNALAGTMMMFIILATILIAGLAAKFRMSNINFGMIMGLFAVMIGYWASWFLFLAVFIGGLLIFFSLGRVLKN